MDEWYEQDVFASLEDPDPIIASRINNDPQRLADALEGFSLSDQESRWSSQHPTLFIAGELDPKYVDIGTRYSALNESVSFRIVPGSGHSVHIEQEEAYLQHITSFLTLDLK